MTKEDIKKQFPEATDEQISAILAISAADVAAAQDTLKETQNNLDAANARVKEYEAAEAANTKNANDLKAAQAELASLKAANSLREMREKVAAAKGLPASLITATTEAECTAQAEAIANYAKSQQPQSYDFKDAGESAGKATVNGWAEVARQLSF